MEERLNYKMIKYEYWNGFNKLFESKLKIFKKPDQEGFTAVILTFDRFDSLIKVIKRYVTAYMDYKNNIFICSIAQAPSCKKILVIWQDQSKPRPQIGSLPHVKIPLVIINTNQNVLSNRFIPYPEIEVGDYFYHCEFKVINLD